MRRRFGRRAGLAVCSRAVLCLASLAPLAGGRAEGQEAVTPRLDGQVRLADEPLPGITVTLHRISPDDAGEIDSVRAGPDGGFDFVLPHVPDPESRSEMFFASVRYRGILYFGAPLTQAVQLDSAYVIQAYDTARAPAGGAALPVRVRNTFLETADGGGWQVTDLFQIANDGERTFVAGEGGATWTYPLPAGATDFELGQGDLAPDQVTYEGDSVRIGAPLPPGERLLVLRYRLEDVATALPMPGETERVELLIREPAPGLAVSRLEALPPVELEAGSSYRRFVGDSLTSVTVGVVPQDVEPGFPVRWLAVILAMALTLAGILAYRRPAGRLPAHGPPDTDGIGDPTTARDQVLLDIARLDEAHARGEGAPDDYARRREALLSRLESPEP